LAPPPLLQPIGTELSVLFPAELKFLRFNFYKKSIVHILVVFLLVVQFMVQTKFNFNNFIFYGVSATAWQRASGIRRRRWRL